MAYIQEISTGGPESDADFRELAIAAFVAAFPLANIAHFYSFFGNADTPRRTGSDFSAGQTRTTSTTYVPKERDPLFGLASLKIYGDAVSTDRANVRRGIDVGNQRTQDIEDFAGSLGRYLMDALVNHDNAANATHTNGLKVLADAAGRTTTLGGPNGFALPRGNDNAAAVAFDTFMEALDEAIEDVDGGVDAIIANGTLLSRMGTMGRQFISTTTVQDVYGDDQRVRTFRDIPIINAGFKANRSGTVIGNAETVGTSTDATSLYLVHYGERRDLTIATNVGLDVVDLGEVGVKLQALVEMDIDQVLLNNKAIKRIAGIRART